MFPEHVKETIGEFDIRTEAGIELRSISVKSLPSVLSLLRHDLTTFLSFWSSVPEFVEEDITRAATALKDEVEVRFTFYHVLRNNVSLTLTEVSGALF